MVQLPATSVTLHILMCFSFNSQLTWISLKKKFTYLSWTFWFLCPTSRRIRMTHSRPENSPVRVVFLQVRLKFPSSSIVEIRRGTQEGFLPGLTERFGVSIVPVMWWGRQTKTLFAFCAFIYTITTKNFFIFFQWSVSRFRTLWDILVKSGLLQLEVNFCCFYYYLSEMFRALIITLIVTCICVTAQTNSPEDEEPG